MKHVLKTALVAAAVTALAGPAFAGIIVHDVAPTSPSLIELVLALLRH
jgi:hypothetical protein